VQLTQAATQKTSGGMTDAYLQYGTYCKSFTTVMMMPSSVKVSMLVTTNQRLHHSISWINTVPMIINERYKKFNLGTEVSEQIKAMETKNNSGSLFKQKKDKPTQPDYTGTATIAEKQYRISGWVNTSKAGTPYLRVLFTEQQSLDLNPSVVQTTAPMTPMSDNTEVVDDLPF
jgi:thioester reductase-like protein